MAIREPISFHDEADLESRMSEPTPRLIESFRKSPDDITILGIGGKIGVTLGMLAARAIAAAGTGKKVYGVSRFSDRSAREKLEKAGVQCIPCDLLDRNAVDSLPDAGHVVFMAGRKFGTSGSESGTWMTNTVAPAIAASRYAGSSIVAYSTGCVYELVTPEQAGCMENDAPCPVGEYAQSALGRERVFEHYSLERGTPVCILRLNYAIDPRYGVLHDIARNVASAKAVDISVPAFNCIWQGDVLERTLLSFSLAASPAFILNLTGPETVPVKRTAIEFGRLFGTTPVFSTGSGDGKAYLNDASLSFRIFGYPRMTLAEMIEIQAAWIKAGGASLGKPTHFEATDGKY
jgi:nucleoside-diphosphate-sugar epimerase